MWMAFVPRSFSILRQKLIHTMMSLLLCLATGIIANTRSFRNVSSALQIHAELSPFLVGISAPCFLPNLITLVADSGLIYFAQNQSYLGPISGRSPAPVTSAVGFNENATLPFVPGKTYRLRIINTSALSAFYFWIDGHNMRLVEVDGVCITYLF